MLLQDDLLWRLRGSALADDVPYSVWYDLGRWNRGGDGDNDLTLWQKLLKYHIQAHYPFWGNNNNNNHNNNNKRPPIKRSVKRHYPHHILQRTKLLAPHILSGYLTRLYMAEWNERPVACGDGPEFAFCGYYNLETETAVLYALQDVQQVAQEVKVKTNDQYPFHFYRAYPDHVSWKWVVVEIVKCELDNDENDNNNIDNNNSVNPRTMSEDTSMVDGRGKTRYYVWKCTNFMDITDHPQSPPSCLPYGLLPISQQHDPHAMIVIGDYCFQDGGTIWHLPTLTQATTGRGGYLRQRLEADGPHHVWWDHVHNTLHPKGHPTISGRRRRKQRQFNYGLIPINDVSHLDCKDDDHHMTLYVKGRAVRTLTNIPKLDPMRQRLTIGYGVFCITDCDKPTCTVYDFTMVAASKKKKEPTVGGKRTATRTIRNNAAITTGQNRNKNNNRQNNKLFGFLLRKNRRDETL